MTFSQPAPPTTFNHRAAQTNDSRQRSQHRTRALKTKPAANHKISLSSLREHQNLHSPHVTPLRGFKQHHLTASSRLPTSHIVTNNGEQKKTPRPSSLMIFAHIFLSRCCCCCSSSRPFTLSLDRGCHRQRWAWVTQRIMQHFSAARLLFLFVSKLSSSSNGLSWDTPSLTLDCRKNWG